MKVHFEKHVGELNNETNKVTFYGLEFASICYAIPFLKVMDPNAEYNTWYYQGFKGVQDSNECVYVCSKWFPIPDEAEYYIRNKYGTTKRRGSHKDNQLFDNF